MMIQSRRRLLTGLVGFVACAPAIVRATSLMLRAFPAQIGSWLIVTGRDQHGRPTRELVVFPKDRGYIDARQFSFIDHIDVAFP